VKNINFGIYVGNLHADDINDIKKLYSKIRSDLKKKGVSSKLDRKGIDFAIIVDNFSNARLVFEKYFPDCMWWWKNPDTATTPKEWKIKIGIM